MARLEGVSLEHTWRRPLAAGCQRPVDPRLLRAGEGLHRLVLRLEATTRRAAARRSGRLAPVRLAQLDPSPHPDDTTSGRGFEIELPHRVRLRCDAAPEPEWLGRLVAALAGLRPQEMAL
jgi:hypothetical protein